MNTLGRLTPILAMMLLLFAAAGVSATAFELAVDNDQGAPGYVETGLWNDGSSTGYLGGSYRYTGGVVGDATASATWTPTLPFHGVYQVYAAYRQSTNRTTSAPLTISHAEGATQVSIKQNGPNQVVETFLGEFLFVAGNEGFVRMLNNGGTAPHIADAMIWRIPEDPPPEITDLARTPECIMQNDPVTITARITDNFEVTSATVFYSVTPSSVTGEVPCFDDGHHGDGEAGDSVFGGRIPPQPEGAVVAYGCRATDNLGQEAESATFYYAVGPLPLFQPDVVVDNDHGPPAYVETGHWTTSSSTGYKGGTYRYAIGTSGASPTCTATWTPDLPTSGVYEVYAVFLRERNRTDNAPVTITHAQGEASLSLDQTGPSAIVEVALGEFLFDPGTSGTLCLKNNGSPGAYIADAVIWRLPSDPPPVISRMNRSPVIPAASEPVQVRVHIVDNIAVKAADFIYTVDGGAPVEIPAYDDGVHGDGEAGDHIFGATIPGLPEGAVVGFHCRATDNLGQETGSSSQYYVVGNEGHNVYVVLSSDTSVWGVTGGYYGTCNWEVFESREGVLSKVFDDRFRHKHVDSLGHPFKITWFMHGGAWFTTAVNATPISATYHMRKNWDDDIAFWKDALEYHFHHYTWNGENWEMAPTFEETIWEYEWVMSELMLEENLFITSFRSGWNYMDDTYQQYLERWVPFRMEGVQDDWTPYHPSFEDFRLPGDMKGWEVRHHYTKSVSSALAETIFRAAEGGADQVVCIWSHQNEADFPEQIAVVDERLHQAHANHPSVQFHYCAAREAMQRWLGHTEEAAPPLELSPVIRGNNVKVLIQTAEDIYQEQPWVAARRFDAECVRLDADPITPGLWQFSYSREEYDLVAVGVSDVYGNEALARVDDGSRRWAVQSEFLRAAPVGLDIDTSPTCAMLEKTGEDYVSSGALCFEHRISPGGKWQSIEMEGNVPEGARLAFRYKNADTWELLDGAAWSGWIEEQRIDLPAGMDRPWIRIEVLLEGTPSVTPKLRSVEVHSAPPPPTVNGNQWMLWGTASGVRRPKVFK